jgi:hypothetical protein
MTPESVNALVQALILLVVMLAPWLLAAWFYWGGD